MREIRFRGKTKYGVWVYGGFVKLNDTAYIVKVERQTFEPYLEIATMEEVDSETVGQYTGLKDRNGKEIYEGDILRTKRMKFSDSGHCIEMVEVIGKVVYRECMFRLELTNGSMPELWFGSNYHEVIGDGRHNPELLKGEETA